MSRSVQLSLPPSLLPKGSQDEQLRTFCSQEPDVLAAQLFDAALHSAAISSKEVADLVGVSRSLVDRWRSENHREQPSFAQMLRLPASFHIALHRSMNRRFGFGRQALARLLEAADDLALAVER